jgi:hypothetical protein
VTPGHLAECLPGSWQRNKSLIREKTLYVAAGHMAECLSCAWQRNKSLIRDKLKGKLHYVVFCELSEIQVHKPL